MGLLKTVLKNKLFWVGLLVPLVFQIIYFCISIPALKDGNSQIQNLKITIVNLDMGAGKSVAKKLSEVLPFRTETATDQSQALSDMDEGKTNMVIYIAEDFSASLQSGGARVQYFINQSTSGMTRQLMERTALSINQTLNEMAFTETKEAVAAGSVKALGQAGLPDGASKMIEAKLSQAFEALKYSSITGDVQKVNNAEGFIQTVFPFFIFLTYFVGCTIMTVLHSLVYKPLQSRYSRSRILLLKLAANILAALIIPSIVISLAAAFNIPFQTGVAQVWLLLSVGFLTLTYLVQMFSEWLGVPGLGLAVVIFFPLQLVTCGLMYSPEILPAFYTSISQFLPASYLGEGLIRMFYGGESLAGDVGPLLLMFGIFWVVTILTLLKKGSLQKTSGTATT
jgi:uncharacterized phage infection (PIP) family protein YhgE